MPEGQSERAEELRAEFEDAKKALDEAVQQVASGAGHPTDHTARVQRVRKVLDEIDLFLSGP